MSKYRINVRFDIDDPKQAEAVKFLQSLEHSRNAFIVSAVLDAVSGKSAVKATPHKCHNSHYTIGSE